MDRLNAGQRVVIVIAIGIALAALGLFLTKLGSPRSGWHAYPPLTRGFWRPGTGLPAWLRLIIWLGLTGIWACASIVLLRPTTPGSGGPQQNP